MRQDGTGASVRAAGTSTGRCSPGTGRPEEITRSATTGRGATAAGAGARGGGRCSNHGGRRFGLGAAGSSTTAAGGSTTSINSTAGGSTTSTTSTGGATTSGSAGTSTAGTSTSSGSGAGTSAAGASTSGSAASTWCGGLLGGRLLGRLLLGLGLLGLLVPGQAIAVGAPGGPCRSKPRSVTTSGSSRVRRGHHRGRPPPGWSSRAPWPARALACSSPRPSFNLSFSGSVRSRAAHLTYRARRRRSAAALAHLRAAHLTYLELAAAAPQRRSPELVSCSPSPAMVLGPDRPSPRLLEGPAPHGETEALARWVAQPRATFRPPCGRRPPGRRP